MSPELRLERAPGIRPWPTLWRAVDAGSRRVFPVLVTFLALVLLAFPWGIPGQAELQWVAALISVWFWTIVRPNSMTASATFCIGLLADLLGDGPLGVGTLIVLALHGIALRNRVRLLRQGFLLVWLGFAGVAAVACVAQWIMTCALEFRLLPPLPACFECALAAGLFPLLALMLTRAHAGVAAPELA